MATRTMKIWDRELTFEVEEHPVFTFCAPLARKLYTREQSTLTSNCRGSAVSAGGITSSGCSHTLSTDVSSQLGVTTRTTR